MIKPRKSVEKTPPYEYPAPFIGALSQYGISKAKALKLDYNEPTIAPSRKVRDALKDYVKNGELQWYPDGDCEELRNCLARYAGVKPENIIVGNGSDEILKVICCAYISEGDEVIVPVPNYSMFIIDAKICGAKIQEVPCNKELQFGMSPIIKAITKNTKAVYISNPNSPVGSVFSRKNIIWLLDNCKNCILIVDESYFEFYGESVCDLIGKHDNLIVTRTFSKAFSLASLRLGYAISNKENIKILAKVKDPESVNALAQIAGIKALKDLNHMQKFVKEILKSREYLSNELRKLGLKVYDSKANFVLARFPDAFNAGRICKDLESKGIFLRDRSKIPLLENCVRIGIPLFSDSGRLISEIKGTLSPLIVFDIDGVLADVSGSYIIAIKKTVEYFTARKISFDKIREYRNRGNLNNDWELTAAVIKDMGIAAGRKSIIKKFQYFYGQLKNNEKWILSKKALVMLSKNYNLAIFTGRPRKEAEYVLRENGAIDYFRIIIAMEDSSKQKPNPEGLLKIMEGYGNRKAYYFGDTVDDMKAAASAGITPIGVLPPQDKSLQLKNLLIKNGAKCVINDINKIMEAMQ